MKRFSVARLAAAFFVSLPLALAAAGLAACDDGDATGTAPGRSTGGQQPGAPAPGAPQPQPPSAPPGPRLCDEWGNLGAQSPVAAQFALNRFGPGKNFYLHMFGPARTMFLVHVREGRAPFTDGMKPGRYTITQQSPSECGLCLNASVGARVDARDEDTAWEADTFYMAVGGVFTVGEPVEGVTPITLENIQFSQLSTSGGGWSYSTGNPCTARLERATYQVPALGL